MTPKTAGNPRQPDRAGKPRPYTSWEQDVGARSPRPKKKQQNAKAPEKTKQGGGTPPIHMKTGFLSEILSFFLFVSYN